MQRVLALVGVGVMAMVLSASTSWAKSTTDVVTTGAWGMGVAVVDPTVPANKSTPSAYAALKLNITVRDSNGGTTLTWSVDPTHVIGGCGAPTCLPAVMKPGVYRFPYVAGVGGPVPKAGAGEFVLTWHDANRTTHRIRLLVQSDTGFAHLPAWAQPVDKVTTGSWGTGVAVADPTVSANDSTPTAYAAFDLKITLRNAYGGTGLTWDDGPNNVIGGCGAPNCLPAVMKPGVYKFPYVAGAGGPVPEAGIGHFTLRWHDVNGKFHAVRLLLQKDIGFAHLPAWATARDKVTTGTWGSGVAVIDPTVRPNNSTPSNYAAIKLNITLRNANPGGTTLNWDDGPNNVIAGCGAPTCLPAVMKPGVYKFPYIAGAGSKVAEAGIGHFTLSWHDSGGGSHKAVLPVQNDFGFTLLPAWAKP